MTSIGRLSRGPLGSKCFIPHCRTYAVQAWGSDATEADLRPGNLPILPSPGRNIDINVATFVKSTLEMEWLPPADKPEFAFIGHSNVGKSSLINLLSRLDMARVSNKPGRTKTLNHFLIDRKWYMVDCPGYGYAKVSRDERLKWHDLTKTYFEQRKSLAQVFLLIDAGHPPQAIDVECASWLAETKIAFSLVYTKTDIHHPGLDPPSHNIAAFNNAIASVSNVSPAYFPTSATTGHGREPLLKYIAQLKTAFKLPLVFK